MQRLANRIITVQDNPYLPRTVSAKVRVVGDKLYTKAKLTGTSGTVLSFRLYPYNTLPRVFGRVLPKVPDAEPVWTAVLPLNPANPVREQTFRMPRGRYDMLVLADDQPISATEVNSDPFNGPLLEGIILLALAISLYYSVRR